jgi:hypothetical protein
MFEFAVYLVMLSETLISDDWMMVQMNVEGNGCGLI